MLVTDRRRSRWPLPELVAAAVTGGVDAVQLREPDLDAAALGELAASLRAVVGERTVLLVNGDVALAARLGLGLHLPQRGAAPAAARRQVGSDRVLGRSVHSPAVAAETTGVDYLLAGHVFATVSKPGRPPLGPDGLGRIVAAARAPVLAIGGITAERVPAVLAAGATGVAVIGAIAEAVDPERAAATLRAAIDRFKEEEMERDGATTIATRSVAIVVNGKPAEVFPDTSVSDFLATKGMTGSMAIVERNGEIVPRRAYDATILVAGDRLEVVHAVGGG